MNARSVRAALPVVFLALLNLGHSGGGCGVPAEELHAAHAKPSGAACPPSGVPTAETFGNGFLDAYCRACHSSDVRGADRHGAPDTLNFDTLEDVRRWATAIDGQAAMGPTHHNGAMPPAGFPQPSHEDRELLGRWLACGAP